MDTLDDRLADIEAEFELMGSWNDRYRLIVDWGTALTPLPEAERTPACFVHGCSSELWLDGRVSDGRCSVRAYSAGVLPLGLAALLVRLYDGLPAAALGPRRDVAPRLGLTGRLSPTRELAFGRMQKQLADALGQP